MWNSITATRYFSLLALLGPEEVELLQGNLVSDADTARGELAAFRFGGTRNGFRVGGPRAAF